MKEVQRISDWEIEIAPLNYHARITVPHTWNVCAQTQDYRGEAIYTTAFAAKREAQGKRVFLRFGAAYHTAVVTLNGERVGVHSSSGHTPFSFDITDVVRFDAENRLEVRVSNQPSEEMLPHLKNFDWADDGGLTRAVSIEYAVPNGIENLFITPEISEFGTDICSGMLEVQVRFYGDAQNTEAEFVICDSKTGETVYTGKQAICDGCATLPFSAFKLWDFEHPNLYKLTVKTEADAFTQKFGLRKIEVRGNQILLNKNPVYLTGCEWMPGSHPDYGMAEPLEHSIMCLKQLKDSGCRFTRFHWQQDSSLYDWCDENGLLVQEEIPYWGSPKHATASQLQTAKLQAQEMLRAHFHHPSIVFWGVGNELGGATQETQSYVREMVAYFKRYDKTRLVNYVSNTLGCLEEGQTDATLFGDVAMWNEYLGLWQPCTDIPGKIAEVNRLCAGKPLIVTEFGLCEPHFDGGDERREALLREHIALFNQAENIQGYVWFSLNDYRTHCGEAGTGRLKQRVHGSTDLYGRKKPSYTALCEVNAQQLRLHK